MYGVYYIMNVITIIQVPKSGGGWSLMYEGYKNIRNSFVSGDNVKHSTDNPYQVMDMKTSLL